MTIYYKSIEKKLDRGKINLGLIIIFGIFVLILVYLFQINAITAVNYQLMEQKKVLREMQSENQKLRVETVQAQSLPYLEKAIQNLNMVNVGKAEYLDNSGDQMAVKKQF